MKIQVLIFTMLLSVVSIAQKTKKTQTTPETIAQPAVEKAKEENKQTNPPPASNLSQHFARKYATAIQWNDYDVAKDALYDLIVENPANDSLITDLAVFYLQNQKYASGALVANELLARNPKNITALEIAATGFENLGVLDRALQNYESLYLLSNNIGVLYKMSFLQYQLKRYKESLASIDILLTNKESETLMASFADAQNKPKDYPLKVAVINLKGMVVRDQGDKAEAKKLFEQALALAPDFQASKQNLAELK